MGLKEWWIRRSAKKYVDEAMEWAARDSALAELERQEKGMDKMGPFLKGLGVAFAAGVVAAGADWMQNGFEFSRAGLYRGLSACVAAGLLAAGAYLKASPIKPTEPTKDEAKG